MKTTDLYPIADDLWGADNFTSLGLGITFPNRMVVARLSNGGLMIHSPLPIHDELAAQLEAIGPVELIIAPNLFHHLYVPEAKTRYPEARLLGAEGFSKKREDIAWDGFLTDEPVAELDGTLARIRHRGTVARENVLFHEKTKTLIITDLVFNITEPPNLVSSLFFGLLGVKGKVKQSPAFRFVATKDHAAAASSLHEILALDWTRLVPAHGPVVESQAKEKFAEGVSWMLSGAPAPAK